MIMMINEYIPVDVRCLLYFLMNCPTLFHHISWSLPEKNIVELEWRSQM